MVRTRKLAGIALAAGLAIGGLTASTAGAATPSLCGGSGQVSALNGKLSDGATYLIECPAARGNGDAVPLQPRLRRARYQQPGSGRRRSGHPGLDARSRLRAGGARPTPTTWWAIQQALPDQISTLNAFDDTYGAPKTTVAWGHSLGGIITAGLLQDYSNRFDAALPMCGVLSGGVATWNTALDAAFAFKQLIDPSVQVVNITNPTTNLQGAETAAAVAQQTAQGRARLALVAALGDTPAAGTPLSPEPSATDYAAQEANQFLWDTQVTFPFVFAFRADLQARAGGNPSWKTAPTTSATWPSPLT